MPKLDIDKILGRVRTIVGLVLVCLGFLGYCYTLRADVKVLDYTVNAELKPTVRKNKEDQIRDNEKFTAIQKDISEINKKFDKLEQRQENNFKDILSAIARINK